MANIFFFVLLSLNLVLALIFWWSFLLIVGAIVLDLIMVEMLFPYSLLSFWIRLCFL